MNAVVGQPAREERVFLLFLDGVRGLAALFVVAHHLWQTYIKVALSGVKGILANWLLYGHLAVDVFIVLSGFCLMLPVARSRSLRGGWRRFYYSRARRILPPMYAALCVAIAAGAAVHYYPTWKAVLANVLLLQDIWQRQNIIDGVLWSVAVECKIYLLFPALVWLWLRSGSRGVILTTGILGVLLTWAATTTPLVLDQGLICPWYVFLFGMGMLGADFALRKEPVFPRWINAWLLIAAVAGLGAALLAWPVTPAGEFLLYVPHLPVIDTAAGFLTALVLMILGRKAMAREPSLVAGWLSWKPLVFLGSIAYSIYLIHGIVMFELRDLVIAALPYRPAWLVIPIMMAIIVGFSWLFHLLFERPFMSKRPPRTEVEAEIAAVINPAP